SRLLGNASSGSVDSLLTLMGNSGGATIDLTSSNTTFTIGPNIDATGTGTARVGLKIANSQTWNVSDAASSLVISADIGERGGARDLTLSGRGRIVFAGTNTCGGVIRLRGDNAPPSIA